jgi:leucyl-tRNA synthetase
MKDNYKDGKLDDVNIRKQLAEKGMLKDKKVMPFVNEQKKLIEKEGEVAFNRSLTFNESEVINVSVEELKRALGFHTITIKGHEEWTEAELRAAETAVPGAPSFNFKNEAI